MGLGLWTSLTICIVVHLVFHKRYRIDVSSKGVFEWMLCGTLDCCAQTSVHSLGRPLVGNALTEHYRPFVWCYMGNDLREEKKIPYIYIMEISMCSMVVYFWCTWQISKRHVWKLPILQHDNSPCYSMKILLFAAWQIMGSWQIFPIVGWQVPFIVKFLCLAAPSPCRKGISSPLVWMSLVAFTMVCNPLCINFFSSSRTRLAYGLRLVFLTWPTSFLSSSDAVALA